MIHPGNEFPEGQDAPPSDASRRDVLRIMGASLALASMPACSRAPRGEIVPYAVQPPGVTPGVASHYATALTREGYGVGVVVESHEGRPTKIEGNPEHPMSLGGSGVFEQASLLGVYDQDRGKSVTRRGAPSSMRALLLELASRRSETGAGLHLLLAPTSSTMTAESVARIRERLPDARVHFHAALSPMNAWAGSQLAFGATREAQIDLRNADVVVAIDSDFLSSGPASLRCARHFAERRRVARPSDPMNRLYVFEPAPTVTGGAADHRVRMRRGQTVDFLAALVAEIVARSPGRVPDDFVRSIRASRGRAPAYERWVVGVASDLVAHRGRSLVVVGEAAPPVAHALAHAANAALESFGRTVTFTESPILDAGEASHSLFDLTHALSSGAVDRLLVLGGNPVYASPADLDLRANLRRAKTSAYLGMHANETAAAVDFHVPMAHPLESWGDARAVDGTQSIVQPLLDAPAPAFALDELLAYVAGEATPDSRPSAHDLTRAYWKRARGADFDSFWRESLTRGIVADSAFASRTQAIDWARIAAACASLPATASASMELVLREDPRVRDGADANNAWLLELPDPVHKLTWENAALVSKGTAARLALTTGDVVRVQGPSRTIDAPVLVVPGVADDTVAIAFGYGRDGAEEVARGAGVDAYALQSSAARWGGPGLGVTKTAARHPLAIAQSHFALEGRDEDIFLHRTLREFHAEPDFARAANTEKRSLYVLPKGGPRQWGMVIDLSACTGCSACVVACQAENNVPVVGKAGVLKSREMHWIRVDRYVLDGADDDSPTLAQPMLCQHCERAPCEYVCPTNATTHSADGLNQMVYNRCVGTRFCSNNCPWKVRRFNWFDYQRETHGVVALARNPDVTVRERGVMEKCTYCVQRIREAEIRTEVAGEPLADRAVTTACEQACPSQAIVFGDIADPGTDVSRARKNPRLFAVLNDLGTVPHTRYLARIANPNEDLP